MSQLLLQIVKRRVERAALATFHRRQALLDRPNRFQPLSQVEQPLIRFRILHDQLGLAVDGQHQRMAGPLELGKELGGVAFEIRQGMNISAQVHFGPPLFSRIDKASNSMLPWGKRAGKAFPAAPGVSGPLVSVASAG